MTSGVNLIKLIWPKFTHTFWYGTPKKSHKTKITASDFPLKISRSPHVQHYNSHSVSKQSEPSPVSFMLIQKYKI